MSHVTSIPNDNDGTSMAARLDAVVLGVVYIYQTDNKKIMCVSLANRDSSHSRIMILINHREKASIARMVHGSKLFLPLFLF